MQLKMWRPADVPVPSIPVPDGFTMRTMRDGEAAAWAACCLGEFGIEEACEEAFAKKGMLLIPQDRIFFICENDVPVATATARVQDGAPFLHYISVRPDRRGNRLSKPLIAKVLQTHVADGLSGCYLTTDDFRVPALHTYLSMGYLPVLWTDDARARWEHILSVLGMDSVKAYQLSMKPAPDVTAKA